MKQNQKIFAYTLGAIVVLAVVVWLANKPAVVPMTSPSPSVSAQASVSVSPTPSSAAKATVAPAAAMPKSYGDAVTAYQGARLQFDMYCQATPRTAVFKNGATIMIDNRSGDARTIKVNGISYALAGYGWRIITLALPQSKLPATLDVDCGTAQNVGTITLQK
jgi:hypothetical protein